jgi:hypothetical protein
MKLSGVHLSNRSNLALMASMLRKGHARPNGTCQRPVTLF